MSYHRGANEKAGCLFNWFVHEALMRDAHGEIQMRH